MTTEIQSDDARFEVVRLLGAGASGKVYHVKDKFHGGADRALKVLENENALDTRSRERFIKEILTLSSIEHKNVVTAYDVVRFQGKDAYTMELVEGDTLDAFLRKFNATNLSVEEIDSVMRQLLLAVDQLHRRGIIHRDIKLENVLLRDDKLVKLNDLGLIKIVGDDPKTDPGILLGTAYYMPPEYVLNKGVDHRMDIYACGMVLWELLSAKRRFKNIAGEKVLRELVANKSKHPMPDLSGDRKKYIKILEKALAYEPKDRFSSAEEMIKAFDGVFTRSKSIRFPCDFSPVTCGLLIVVLVALFTVLIFT